MMRKQILFVAAGLLWLQASAWDASEKGALLCEHFNGGGKCCDEGPGVYNYPYFGTDCDIGNDKLSSVVVKAGCVATLTEHYAPGTGKSTGKMYTLAGPGQYNGGDDFLNDEISSLVVTCVENGALLCEHGNLGGKCCEEGPGVYTYPYIGSSNCNVGNDKLSSVLVAPGCAVFLQQHHAPGHGSTGNQYTLGGAGLYDYTKDFKNDDISSFVVKCVEQGALLCEHGNLQGNCCEEGTGVYTYPYFGSSECNVGNDKLSSVLVAPGCTVDLQQHHAPGKGATGKTWSLDEEGLYNYGSDFNNDDVSSFVVTCKNTGAMLCEHMNLEGKCCKEGPGTYNYPYIGSDECNVGNDKLSSVRVAEGCVVELQQHYAPGHGATGKTFTLEGPGTFNAGGDSFTNDDISSFVVTCGVTTCKSFAMSGVDFLCHVFGAQLDEDAGACSDAEHCEKKCCSCSSSKEDSYEDCADWADEGYCKKTYVDWMKAYCENTCCKRSFD